MKRRAAEVHRITSRINPGRRSGPTTSRAIAQVRAISQNPISDMIQRLQRGLSGVIKD
jgi:hypothetical protein